MIPAMMLAKMKELWDKTRPQLLHWTPAIIAIGVLVYVVRRPTPPEKVIERVEIIQVTKVDTRINELINTVDSLNKKLSEVRSSQVKESYRKWEKEETKPDGTRLVDKGEEHNIDSVVKEEKTLTEVRVVEVEKQVVVTQTVNTETKTVTEKIVESSPRNWRVSPMVGVGFDVKSGPTFNGVVYGASAERRVFKNVWVGAWGLGNSQIGGIVGVKASIEF